jgi:indole-3-glycerol phosphate synthase
MSLLQTILSGKRAELAELKRRKLPTQFSPRPFALGRAQTGRLGLICEIKLRSPSAGALSRQLSVEARAAAYAAGGADMISVLCDERHFEGDYAHLQRAREACNAPLLCKEFIIHPAQLDAARAFGADAALLIVRCLQPNELRELILAAEQRELAALVEVHTQQEAQIALDAGATWVGVNARDLDTLKMNLEGAQRVLAELPTEVTKVHLSGLKRPEDLAAVASSAADAALIGEALMRQDDPAELLAGFVRARG